MPRLRVPAIEAVDGVPAELFDPEHEVWKAAEAACRWFERNVGRPHEDLERMGPRQRYNKAARVWTIAHGHFKTFTPDGARHPDWAYMRQIGLPRVSDIAERLEMAVMQVE